MDKLSRKFIVYVILFLLIISSLPIMTIYYSNNKNDDILASLDVEDTASCISLINNSGSYSIDLNGDGNKDFIYYTVKNNKYHIYVESNGSEDELIPNQPLNIIGTDTLKNISLHFMDVTRNHIPDIFVQSFDNKTPVTHIFSLSDKKFKDIFSSTDNCIGTIDTSNNRTPKVISFNITKEDEEIKEFMYINNRFSNISYEKDSIDCIPVVQSLIGTIELPYEVESGPDIFTTNADDYTKSILWRLLKVNNTYTFNSCFFKDSKSDKNGNPIEYTWLLNFSRYSKDESKLLSTEIFTINIIKVDDSYKVNSIKQESKPIENSESTKLIK